MKTLIISARKAKKLRVKELAALLSVDATLVSRWENGSRKPNRSQIHQLAEILDLDLKNLLIEWMSETVLYEIGNDSLALEALKVAEEKIKYMSSSSSTSLPADIEELLKNIDSIKAKLDKYRHLDSYRIAQALELQYIFDSNRIEGNTLTLKETDLVINEGITIGGKSMREHLEAINHQDAVEYLKQLVKMKSSLKERDIISLHNLILRGIDTENAGKYRNVQVMIKGSQHIPPQPFLVSKKMEELMEWFTLNSQSLHPVILAAELSERLVTIHPFVDGNGRTSRLLMNLILLKNGYVIANIKGDNNSRLAYYNALETVQVSNNKNEFYRFIASTELRCIQEYYQILNPSGI